MQCPPTPGPGEWMCEYGCVFDAAIASRASTPSRSAMRANSFASAMLTSRYVVSASFENSAVSASRSSMTSRVQHLPVERRRPRSARRVDAADDLRIDTQVPQDACPMTRAPG